MSLPAWAQTLSEIFLAGTTSTFVLHGNVFDLVPTEQDGQRRYVSLKQFLDGVLFPGFDLVVHYDRGVGLRYSFPTGHGPLKATTDSLMSRAGGQRVTTPRTALEIIDRLVHEAIYTCRPAAKVAVIIRYAELVAPAAEVGHLGGEAAEAIVRLAAWAEDPTIVGQNVVFVLVSERAGDLSRMLSASPHVARIHVPLPDEGGVRAFLEDLADEEPRLGQLCEVPTSVLAQRLVGLPRVDVRDAVFRHVRNGRALTDESLRRVKKELIEAECGHLLELIETDRTLDLVAGHDAVKRWLRQDAELLSRGRTHALPMGYLLMGRIGTGKTFLATCWAGELGLPCVILRNFRERWVGATEGNLEKIFAVLEALGQCLVFVDEADQITGRRGGDAGDSGLSGRVYAALARAMSDTTNRGRILWMFATSRPDLLEDDLKRQGRLDVHMPLFPPSSQGEKDALLGALAVRLGAPVAPGELPPVPEGLELGGNELEGVLVRAMRLFELEAGATPLPQLIEQVFRDVRPLESRMLRYMDLMAVRDCTDRSFLPPRYASLDHEDIDRQLALLMHGPKPLVGDRLAASAPDDGAAVAL